MMVVMETQTTALPSASKPLAFASGWQRTGACILDTIICMIVFSIIKIVLRDALWQNIAYWILVTAYYLACEAAPQQATLGKRIIGIYLAPRGGSGRISWGTAGLRYLVWMLPALPMACYMFSADFNQLQQHLQEASSQYEKQMMVRDPAVMKLMIGFSLSMLFALVASVVFYYLPFCFSKEKTALHDWASKTRVYVGKPVTTGAGQDKPDAAA